MTWPECTLNLTSMVQTRLRKRCAASFKGGQNLREPLGDIGEHLLYAHRKRWDVEQSPDGIPREHPSEKYAERKRRMRPAAGIPVYDDLLKGTLRHQIRKSVGKLSSLARTGHMQRHTSSVVTLAEARRSRPEGLWG